MGDPRKLRKKYSKPNHPWQKARIDEEKLILKEYGMKNKTELWRHNSELSNFKNQLKELIPRKDPQAQKEKKQLMNKLLRYKLIKENAIPEDILAITLKDYCERRLQTIVVRKGLARSMNQARKLIVHRHIAIGDRKITSPSYLIDAGEEPLVRYADNSPFNSEEHPERIPATKVIKEEMRETGLKEDPKPKSAKKKTAKQELKEDVKREESQAEEEE